MLKSQGPEVAIAILGKKKPKSEGAEKPVSEPTSDVDPALETHMVDFLAAQKKGDAAGAARAMLAFHERCYAMQEMPLGGTSDKDEDDEDDED